MKKISLSDEMKASLSDPELVAIRNAHFDRMEAVFDGRDRCKLPMGMFGYGNMSEVALGDDPVEKAILALEETAEHIVRAADTKIFHPIFVSPGLHGVSFVDRILETELTRMPDWQALYLESPVGTLEYPDLAHNEMWQLATDFYSALVESAVTLPVFGTPCLSSALNEATNLYGEKFLLAMAIDTSAARRDLELINDVLVVLHGWFRRNIPEQQLGVAALSVRTMPPGYGHIDGCSTHLISGDMYRDVVSDLDEALLAIHPKGGMVHLCGRHTQHIDSWRAMKSVRVIQLSWPAEEDLETYFDNLRVNQIFYAGPCRDMSMDRIMQATGGHRLIIAADVEPPLPPKMILPRRARAPGAVS